MERRSTYCWGSLTLRNWAVFEANAEVFSGRSIRYIQNTFEERAEEVADDYPDHRLWTLAWVGDKLTG
jgi:mycothiol synthase